MKTVPQPEVRVIHRPVKHIRLRVREDSSVEVIAPLDFSERQIESILERKSGWIQRNQQFFRSRQTAIPPNGDEISLFGRRFRFEFIQSLGRRVSIDESESVIRAGRNLNDDATRYLWYRSFARLYLKESAERLSKKHSLQYNRLFVRFQKTRWGSCSARKNISLNWQLITAPKYVIDYVILHELLHTTISKHTHRFWVYLASLHPEVQRARDWLEDHVSTLDRGPTREGNRFRSLSNR